MPQSQEQFNETLSKLSKIALSIVIQTSGLKRKYEAILKYRLIDELSYSEIADKMGMTEGSVGNLLCKAKKELKVIIDKEGELFPDDLKKYINLLK